MSLITHVKKLGLFYIVVMSIFTSLSAHQITIDPEKYTGSWYVFTPNYTRFWGVNTIELPTGRHQIRPNHEALFYINIDETGSVTVENNVSAKMIEDVLTFKTVPVNIEVNGFEGRWFGPDGNGYTSGSRTLNLVPGVYGNYGLALQHANPGSGLRFTLGNNSEITVDNTDATIVEGNTITFQNANVEIDPKDYKYHYGLDFLALGYYNAPTTFLLPVGLTHRIIVGNRSPILFTFNPDGSVVSLNPDSAVGGQNLLTFKTTPFTFNTQLFEGAWNMGVRANRIYWENGSSEHMMVPGVQYNLRVMGQNNFQFDLDENGTVFNISKTESAKSTGNTLTLKNVSLTVDPNGMDSKYLIDLLESINSWYMEPMSFTAVPGLKYSYIINSHAVRNTFSIDANGNVSMEDEKVATVEGGSIQFNVSEVIIEPKEYDGLWHLYGFGPVQGSQTYRVVSGMDHKVLLYGPYEYDTFFAYDECYSDTQSLNVSGNLFDVTIACTQVTDADIDGVEDDIDNCPMIANPDQADFDGDAIGDVCDADMDADNVLKDIDMCQNTPLGSLVTSNGCSAFQYIDLNCVDTKNHGQFVSCVAHRANELVDENVIAPTEKKTFIKAAAKAK